MGTKVQIENYLPAHYPMKDLNHESNGAGWPSCFGENNLSNGQIYYGFLPRTIADSHLGYDKDFVKQTMLEHEAIFKNQVYELHRLYRVQRDLMEGSRRKEQCKRGILYETSSSSSPIPSQLQYDDVQRWNGPNLQSTNSIYGRPPILAPEIVQSSPNSAKGKSIQAGPSSLPNCYSPKNSESESRPTKLRRRMLDLQLPADEYIDSDEMVQYNDIRSSDYTSPSPDKNRKYVAGSAKHFMIQGNVSRSDLHVRPPKALADLNEPLLVEEATSVAPVDLLRHGGGSQCDTLYRDFSARLVNTFKDVPQIPKNGTINGTSNNVHFENRTNAADWFSHAVESENKGSTRSISQGIFLEKMPVPSQSVHILHDQACQPPAFLTGDHIKGDTWQAKAGDNTEKSDRVSYSLSSYNVSGAVASHLSNHPAYFHSSDLGKPRDQYVSPWGKPGSFLGQKPLSIQTSPYLTSANVSKSSQSSAQSNNMFGSNKWNLNNIPLPLRNETPVRNGFNEGSSSAFRGFDYVNSNYSDKKVPCSSINYYKAENCIDLNPMKGMNLNVALPNGLSDDHISQQGAKNVKENKSEDPLAVLPWLRGKTSCNYKVENLRKDLNSLESSLSHWGSSVASNSFEVDIKAKISDSSRKILGVPIFENPPPPKKEVSNPMIIHCCSEINKESESSGRKGLFDINVPCDPSEEEVVILETKTQTDSASMRHNFDLNSCVDDEEVLYETTFSVQETRTSIRVDTGIDLEAPIILENEEAIVIPPDEDPLIKESEKQQVLPQHNADDGESELAKSAASAIVAISSLVNLNQSEEATCRGIETDLDDPLLWFVEIACLDEGNDTENGNDLLPEGLDDFEMMTLRQKECNEEEYFPKSSFPDVPNTEERGTCVLTTARTRKGNARRGRQRRDFQRDILPGLTSLSRHEVTEDLQMFGGLMRATGHPWHSGSNRRNTTRNGCARGRRRCVGTTSAVVSPSPAPVAALCAVPVKQQSVQSNNTEVAVDDRSLTGWGKTTRRPRRQRCPAGNPAPPVIPLT